MSPSSGSGYHTKTLWLIVISVGVWWAANSITAISSKSVMKDSFKSAAFIDFRWFELTALQHLLGAVVSVIWLKVVLRKPVWPAEASKQIISMAALGNVVGNMATNAAYAMVSSSMTQVVKACEPLFMFGLSLLLYRDYKVINATTLLSIVIMVAGASLFVAFDSTFIVCGLLAALCSNIAFPIRNIYLKKLSTVWENSFQKYAVISLYSVFVLTPFMLVKLFFTQSFALLNTLNVGIISSSFHCTYNLASIYVLQSFSPLSHAILNLLKRGIVIVVNLIYFQSPLSWRMIIGLIAVLAGLYCYLNRSLKGQKFSPPTAVLVLVVVLLLSLFFIPFRMETSIVKSSQQASVNLFHVPQSRFESFPKQPQLNEKLFDTVSDLGIKTNDPALYEEYNINPADSFMVKHSEVKSNSIRSAWVYDRPIPSRIVSNLQSLSKHAPVHVYCGTSHCIQAISNISSPDVTTEFLLIGELVKGTPFHEWLALHPFYKVLAGTSYEDHLQEVVRLGILWKYGGMYIEPNVAFSKDLDSGQLPECSSQAWVGQAGSSSSTSKNLQRFSLACFSKNHPFIEKLSGMVVEDYYKPSKDYSSVPSFMESFMEKLSRIIVQGYYKRSKDYSPIPSTVINNDTWMSRMEFFSDSKLPKVSSFTFKFLSTETDQPWNHHYGTFFFDTRVHDVPNTNVGDEIQGYPGLQFLPFLDNFLDRDDLGTNENKDETILAFFNAWWGSDRVHKWPPPSNVDPIMLAVHIGNDMKRFWKRDINYVKHKSPVGCRDYTTLDFLAKLGVSGYFSGCLTLMLQSPYIKADRTDDIYIVDVNKEYFNMLPQEIQKKGIRITHNLKGDVRWHSLGRFTEAFKMIELYSRAKLVITQRIHSALPCVAMGTPVIFINSASMPGGGGSKTVSSSRTVGLTSMFHTLDLYKVTKDQAPQWFANFPWDNIPPNPDMATVMRLRATFWNVIRKKPSLYDAGRKFGLIPMTPPGPCASHILFHAVFTSPDSKFTWQNHRSIESIFRHHPCATVLVHSNTLNMHRFDVLKESGFLIDVARYDIGTLAPEIKDLPSTIDESFVLRSLILYKWGGIYMDMNIILVQPLTNLPANLLVWGDSAKDHFDCSFMIFEKNSKFLQLVLTTSAQDLVSIDNGLFTRVWKESQEKTETHDSDSFFVFDKDDFNDQCYESTSGPKFEANKKVIREKAFGVFLSQSYSTTLLMTVNTMKSGTLCNALLNDFCILCNEMLG